MSPVALSTLLALVIASTRVVAQSASAFTPLASKTFPFTALPYQADPDNGVRGTQQGYNQCNSTTENQQSLCQTAILNSIGDFCLWGPPTPNATIGDTEGEEVAWCTKKGHGTRLIPQGALQGVQVLVAPGYIEFVGFIDQSQIDLDPTDPGGELDPHGADMRGNPLGGVVYTTAYDNSTYQQVVQWTNFMGSNQFCFKICKPGAANAPLCQNIYDRIGVNYNCPAAPTNGTFEVCDSDNQLPAGVYVSNGQTMTYTQPPESLGAITSIPYTPTIPASSNCQQFQSAALYTDLPTPTGVAVSTIAGSSSTGAPSAPSRSGSSTGTATSTGSASSSNANGAGVVGVSFMSTVMVVMAAVAFLA